MFDHLKPNVLWALGGVIAVLVLASVIVAVLAAVRRDKDYGELKLRMRSWWWMVGIFAAAMLLSPTAAVVFWGFVSFLALKEYLSLIPTRRADRRVLFWAYLAIPIHYYWAGIAWYGMFVIFIPVFMFLLLPLRMVTIGETQGFLRAAGTLHWGMMAMVFSISHLAYLLVLDPAKNAAGAGAGLLLYLVFLTQFNDVAQYTWGKLFGKHKVIPKVSPKKTWEGLIGGILTTLALAVLIAPYLTPLRLLEAIGAGLIIGVFGFIGDVTISAVKRDIGVKDSGTLIPGHGGVLDRVDSLTYTAPLFFHYVYYLHY
ncbi:phosphatidate cytidylyltransferase [Thiobacter aerophilum]|uniref:Phosphatidate cytidylyltransferase n=1 Tax=Thiobacter aerophilum TaxID=3121275 RepID=A0ABV0EH63_9BURK